MGASGGRGIGFSTYRRLTRWVEKTSRCAPLLQGAVFGAVLFAIVGLLGAEGMTRFIYIGF